MGQQHQGEDPRVDSFWTRAEVMVKAAIALWPVRSRLELASRLDRLATEIRQGAMGDMRQPEAGSARR